MDDMCNIDFLVGITRIILSDFERQMVSWVKEQLQKPRWRDLAYRSSAMTVPQASLLEIALFGDIYLFLTAPVYIHLFSILFPHSQP